MQDTIISTSPIKATPLGLLTYDDLDKAIGLHRDLETARQNADSLRKALTLYVSVEMPASYGKHTTTSGLMCIPLTPSIKRELLASVSDQVAEIARQLTALGCETPADPYAPKAEPAPGLTVVQNGLPYTIGGAEAITTHAADAAPYLAPGSAEQT